MFHFVFLKFQSWFIHFLSQAVVDFSNGISVEENTILMKTPRFFEWHQLNQFDKWQFNHTISVQSAASRSQSSGGLPSLLQSGSASASPPSPWPSSCSSSSQRSRSTSSLTRLQRQWDLFRLSGSFLELLSSRVPHCRPKVTLPESCAAPGGFLSQW